MRQELIDLYDDFTHDRIGRREFFDRLALLVGGAAAASAVLAQIAPNYALAAVVPEGDQRVTAERVQIPEGAITGVHV